MTKPANISSYIWIRKLLSIIKQQKVLVKFRYTAVGKGKLLQNDIDKQVQ